MTALSIGWIVEAIVASAVLMALVLLVRVPVRRAFGPQVAYALWALPLLRLMLPPLPASWREAAATPIARASETITVLMADPDRVVAAVPVAAAPGLAVGPAIALLWAAGAGFFLIWHLVHHNFYCRRMLRSSEVIDELSGVRVIASDDAAGPLAFGVVRRYVAFPRDFDERYDAEERALALAHEIGHHQRGDLIANWAALGVLALHWFNPLAWRAFRAFRADQELANDARVLAGRSALERHAYACAIIKAAHGGAVSAACHLHTIDDLKGRLRMLKQTRASGRQLATGSLIVSLVVVAGLGLTASGTSAATAISERVETATGLDLHPAAPPAPPAPAAPLPPVPGAGDHDVSTTIVRDGRTIRKHVVVIRDGQRVEDRIDVGEIPDVRERNCDAGKDGSDREIVLHSRNGKRRVMIICTNRVAAMAAEGAAMAANGKEIARHARESALAGLRSARVQVESARAMAAADRVEALAGIDEGILEVEADMAAPD